MIGNARLAVKRARAALAVGASLALVAVLGLPAAEAQQSNDVVVPNGYQVREFASGLGAAIAASVAPSGERTEWGSALLTTSAGATTSSSHCGGRSASGRSR